MLKTHVKTWVLLSTEISTGQFTITTFAARPTNQLFWSSTLFHHMPHPVSLKKRLHIFLVRSQLSFCSQFGDLSLLKSSCPWNPCNAVRQSIIYKIIYCSTYKIWNPRYAIHHQMHQNPRLIILTHRNIFLLLQVLQDLHPITKLWQNLCRTSCYRHFYFSCIVKLWNAFPNFDTSLSMSLIKTFLTTHIWNHFITHFNSEISCTFHFVCPCNNCYTSNARH